MSFDESALPSISKSDIELVTLRNKNTNWIVLKINIAAHCPHKTCPGEGFVGKDCKCYCDGTSQPGNQNIIECGGDTGGGTGGGEYSGISSPGCTPALARCTHFWLEGTPVLGWDSPWKGHVDRDLGSLLEGI